MKTYFAATYRLLAAERSGYVPEPEYPVPSRADVWLHRKRDQKQKSAPPLLWIYTEAVHDGKDDDGRT